MIVVPGRVISANCVLNSLNPGIKFFLRRISKFQRENEKFGVRVVVRTSFGKDCKTFQYLLRAQHCSIVDSSFNHAVILKICERCPSRYLFLWSFLKPPIISCI